MNRGLTHFRTQLYFLARNIYAYCKFFKKMLWRHSLEKVHLDIAILFPANYINKTQNTHTLVSEPSKTTISYILWRLYEVSNRMLSRSGLVETPKTHSAVLQLKFNVNSRFYDPYHILSHSTLLCHSVVEDVMVQTSHPPQRWASFCPLGRFWTAVQ